MELGLRVLPSRLKIRRLASPNHRSREGQDADLIVLHAISCPPGKFGSGDIEKLFLGRLDSSKDPAYREVQGKELSAHFLIDRRGRVTQFVDTCRSSYHAGRSSWQGRPECNDFSIGIELEGDERHRFTMAQYRKLALLCRDLMQQHPAITAGRIVGHSDVAPGRKTDPGPTFDWEFFRQLLRSALESYRRGQILK